MKAKILLLILFPLWGLGGYAQKELWGVNKGADDNDPNSTGYKGNITKYDIDGKNPAIMHEFTDFATGKTPKGKLFLASNGKLYGTTIGGGNSAANNYNGFGVLYEYDLILDKYRIIHYFDLQNISGSGVIEPNTGKLYGSTGNKIFCYDLSTDIFTILSGTINYNISGEIMKASNGFLYGATLEAYCPSSTPSSIYDFGSVFKINTSNQSVQTVCTFSCNTGPGIALSGGLIETLPNKLYGTTFGGGLGTNDGLIFEFDTTTNIATYKVSFDGNNLGTVPSTMVNGGNGKLYGVCTYGGLNPVTSNPSVVYNYAGTLFEYDYSTNSLTKLYDFKQQNPLVHDGFHPTSIMKASTGHYFGISSSGIFKFNPIDNSVIIPCYGCYTSPPNSPYAGVTETLIEICRKPSYHEITTNTYAPSVGDTFTYDIQNTNATTYVWQNGTTVLPTQTTSILNLPNLAISDSGTYTCTMTNECGTTTTAPIYLNVLNLGVDAFSLENSITLYPNPTNSWLTINLPKNNEIEIQKCTIATIEGKRVYKSTENNTKIDVSGFAKGIYIITLKTNLGDWSGKFVKE